MVNASLVIGISAGFGVLIFCGIMAIRNEIVFNSRMRAIQVARRRADEMARDGKSNYLEPFDSARSHFGSYGTMLWSFRKWKYEDFYPGWE